MGTRGNVRVEWLFTLLLVALVGGAGLRALGGSFDAAIAGSGSATQTSYAGGAAARAMVVSSEAGTWQTVGKGLDALRELEVSKTATAAERAVAHGTSSARGVAAKVGSLEWSEKSIRMGVPDHAHEAPQMLRYADMKGGGLYFVPEEEFARGIDGFFVPWKSSVPVDLTRFHSVQTRVGGHTVAVSLKDFTKVKKTGAALMHQLLVSVEKNAHNVRKTTATPQKGVPNVIATDLFITLPQETMHSMAEQFAKNRRWQKVVKRGTVRSNAGAAFRSIYAEVRDGVVVLTSEMKDGEAVRVVARTDGKVLRFPFPAVVTQPSVPRP